MHHCGGEEFNTLVGEGDIKIWTITGKISEEPQSPQLFSAPTQR
jgi:hypothetical protein